MKDRKRDSRSAGQKTQRVDRRYLLRLGATAAIGGLIFTRVRDRKDPSDGVPGSLSKISILSSCAGCTGCIAVCPTAAITTTPRGGIKVSEDLCIRCGYCCAACPSQGIRVNREAGN
ncbi:MAG: hypothetical protein GY847_29120 [Proteobacteria bacterium]|nr:hypothetical protein [Pseudomonadota bacterium]